jgi:hypothetical protein
MIPIMCGTRTYTKFACLIQNWFCMKVKNHPTLVFFQVDRMYIGLHMVHTTVYYLGQFSTIYMVFRNIEVFRKYFFLKENERI